MKAFSNTTDVVECLRDPTDQVPNARHLRDLHTFSSVKSLAEAEGELRQHDGVLTVMMKLPTQGFA